MKGLILLTTTLFFTKSFSQNTEILYAEDSVKAVALSSKIASVYNEILSSCGKSKLDRVELECFNYCDTGSNITLRILYEIKIEGAHKYYFLNGLAGNFIEVFNVWKLIDPTANQEEILKKGKSPYIKYEVGGEKKRIQISRDTNGDNTWTIEQTTAFY